MAASIEVNSFNAAFTPGNNAAFYGNSFTVSCWYKLKADPSNYAYVAGNQNSFSAGWGLYSSAGTGVDDLKPLASTTNGSTSFSVKDTTARTVNTWNFVAFTLDTTNNQLKYFWGNESTTPTQIGSTVTTSGTMPSDTTKLYFGSADLDHAIHDILISDLRIYNATVRTLGAIQGDYLQRLVGNETGLTDYWKLNDGSGNTAVNSTSSRNATAVAGVWAADEPAFTTGVVVSLLFSDI